LITGLSIYVGVFLNDVYTAKLQHIPVYTQECNMAQVLPLTTCFVSYTFSLFFSTDVQLLA